MFTVAGLHEETTQVAGFFITNSHGGLAKFINAVTGLWQKSQVTYTMQLIQMQILL